MFMAIGMLSLIFGIMALVSPIEAFGASMAMALVIGGVSYEGEDAMAKAIDDITAKFTEKMSEAATKSEIYAIKKEAAAETKLLLETMKASITEDLQAKIDEQTERLKSQGEAIELKKVS